MNLKDKKRLERLNELINAVPFPSDGSSAQSATMTGYTGYANDMHMFEPLLKNIIQSMLWEYINSTLDPEEYDLLTHYDIEKLLDRGEEWIAKRHKEGWQQTDRCYLLNGIKKLHEE